jgi:hypothetical protein
MILIWWFDYLFLYFCNKDKDREGEGIWTDYLSYLILAIMYGTYYTEFGNTSTVLVNHNDSA